MSTLVCRLCRARVAYVEVEQHMRQSHHVGQRCPYCDQRMRDGMATHLSDECELAQFACAACGAVKGRRLLKLHWEHCSVGGVCGQCGVLEDSEQSDSDNGGHVCAEERTCGFCRKTFEDDEECFLHMQQCAEMLVKCVGVCGKASAAGDDHACRCRHCHATMQSSQLMEHIDECTKLPVECSQCSLRFARDFMDEHKRERCRSRRIECMRCGETITYDRIMLHSCTCVFCNRRGDYQHTVCSKRPPGESAANKRNTGAAQLGGNSSSSSSSSHGGNEEEGNEETRLQSGARITLEDSIHLLDEYAGQLCDYCDATLPKDEGGLARHLSMCMMYCDKCCTSLVDTGLSKAEHLGSACPAGVTACSQCFTHMTRGELWEHKEVCPKRKLACQWCLEAVAAERLAEHEEDCPSRFVFCSLCKEKVKNFALRNHMRLYCDMRPMSCLYCGEKVPYHAQLRHQDGCTSNPKHPSHLVECSKCGQMVEMGALATHLSDTCERRMVRCRLCTRNVLVADEEEHMANVCLQAKVECGLGCGVQLPRGRMFYHEEHQCMHREVACTYCKEVFVARELDDHLLGCTRRDMECIHCYRNYPRDELKAHTMTCERRPVDCPNEQCVYRGELRMMATHQEQCPMRLKECRYCFQAVPASLMLDHEDTECSVCPYCKIECDQGCGVFVQRGSMSMHKDFRCPNTPMRCSQCGSSVQRNGMAAHQRSCTGKPMETEAEEVQGEKATPQGEEEAAVVTETDAVASNSIGADTSSSNSVEVIKCGACQYFDAVKRCKSHAMALCDMCMDDGNCVGLGHVLEAIEAPNQGLEHGEGEPAEQGGEGDGGLAHRDGCNFTCAVCFRREAVCMCMGCYGRMMCSECAAKDKAGHVRDAIFEERLGPADKKGSYETGELLSVPRTTELLGMEGVSVFQRMRGIQGRNNSCFMDATLFGLFAFNSGMDDAFFGHHAQGEWNARFQDVLRTAIVNPLRERLFVSRADTYRFRIELNRVMPGNDPEGDCEERDVDEFLNVVFDKMQVEEFVEMCNEEGQGRQKVHIVAVFLGEEDRAAMAYGELPTTGETLVRHMNVSGMVFARAPRVLIVQMPRYGTQYKTFDQVLPQQRLDLHALGLMYSGSGEKEGEAQYELSCALTIGTSHFVAYAETEGLWTYADSMCDMEDHQCIPEVQRVDEVGALLALHEGGAERSEVQQFLDGQARDSHARRICKDLFYAVYVRVTDE